MTKVVTKIEFNDTPGQTPTLEFYFDGGVASVPPSSVRDVQSEKEKAELEKIAEDKAIAERVKELQAEQERAEAEKVAKEKADIEAKRVEEETKKINDAAKAKLPKPAPRGK